MMRPTMRPTMRPRLCPGGEPSAGERICTPPQHCNHNRRRWILSDTDQTRTLRPLSMEKRHECPTSAPVPLSLSLRRSVPN
eukprot:scaffold744_cov240-Pinguiococcus_pyrenoidosus.AAC.3